MDGRISNICYVNSPEHFLRSQAPHENVPPDPRDEDGGLQIDDAGVGRVGADADVADAAREAELLAGTIRFLDKRKNDIKNNFFDVLCDPKRQSIKLLSKNI